MGWLGNILDPLNVIDPTVIPSTVDPRNIASRAKGNDGSKANSLSALNQTAGGIDFANARSTSVTDDEIAKQFGLSSDNPNLSAAISSVKGLMGQGLNFGAAMGVVKGTGSAMGPFGGDAYYQSAGIDQGKAAGAYETAKSWEGENAGTTPAQRALNTQITDTANTFQANMPKLEYSLTAQAAEAQKSQLATAIQGTKANSNAMGLLYGNYEQGAENSDVQGAAANVQKASAGINQTVSQENEGLQNNAIQMQNTIQAMNQAGAGNNTNLTNQYNNISEQQTALNNQAEATMGGAFGNVVGTAIGASKDSGNGGYAPPVTNTLSSQISNSPTVSMPEFGQGSLQQYHQSQGLGSGG